MKKLAARCMEVGLDVTRLADGGYLIGNGDPNEPEAWVGVWVKPCRFRRGRWDLCTERGDLMVGPTTLAGLASDLAFMFPSLRRATPGDG